MKYYIIIALCLLALLSACAVQRHKLSPTAKINLLDADVFYQQKNVEKALESYLKVLQDNPEHAHALRRVGDIYLYWGEQNPDKEIENNKKAYEAYAKAITVMETYETPKDDELASIRTMKKNSEGAWVRIYNSADRQLSLGNTMDAVAGFEIAAALDKTKFQPIFKLKEIYDTKLDDDDKAEEYLLKLYELKPKELPVLQEIGAFYYNKKDFPKSLEFFLKAKELSPRDINILMNITFCYFELERNQDALAITKEILAIDPRNIDALSNAKIITMDSEDDAAAIGYTKTLLEIRDDDTDYNHICNLLNKTLNYPELITYAEKWRAFDETSKEAVQYIILGANMTKNKALETRYIDILKKMQ
ncbi:MAG: hypothetical protein PHI68_05560 [Candidatus Cloacimonetes bacterium]|nr:hypothetical protein [Candidatus Cloacimonadota bacterium]